MSETELLVYAGATAHHGLSDLTRAGDIARALARCDGVVIRDPLAFPWNVLDAGPPVPVVVDLSEASTNDLIALGPVLSSLTDSDVLLGERRTVEHFCSTHGLANLWAGDHLGLADHVRAVRNAKIAEVEERAVLERLDNDPDCVAIQLSGDAIRKARSGFADLVEQIRTDTPGLEDSVVHTIWGIRTAPGAPLDRAVLAFTRPPPSDAA